MRRYLPLVLISACLISACSAYRTQVIDTPESRGLKGWQKPYMVNGRRYEPLLDHKGFVEEGTASWYGDDFHGGSTSNGETYDMHALTAAHKVLPMGVYVRVRNKENGKEVTVRINDRGPFVKERIVDLSMAAAQKIGMADKGTAQVQIEALGYLDPQRTSINGYLQPKSYDTGDFSVQIAAFSERDNAERLTRRMKNLYGAATIQEAMVGGGRFFRVRVGNFGTMASAQAAQRDFEARGFPGSFIISTD